MRALTFLSLLPLVAAGVRAQAPASPAASPTIQTPAASAPSDPMAALPPEVKPLTQADIQVGSANTMSLEQALQTARAHAPELRQAAAATDAARARVGSAKAPLLPQITGSAGYTRGSFNSGVAVPTHPSSFDTRDSWSFGIRISQLIYDFGQTWNVKEAAKLTALAQEQSEHATELDISFDVRDAFLTAAANKALWEVSVATQKNQERHLEQIQGFFDVGTRPAIDLAQAKTDVANAKLAVLRAQNAYADAKASLSRAMGVNKGGADYDVDATLPPAEEGEADSVEALVDRAEKLRPDFTALREQVMAEETTLSAIKGQYGPSLGAVGSADESGYKLNNLVGNFSIGAALTWPIFQGGLTNSRVDEAHALVRGLNAQLDELRENLRLALTQSVLSVQAAQAELSTAEDLVNLAKDRLVLAEGRYQTGVGNTIELGDAELALRDAQTQRVTAEYDLAIARAQLRHSLGRM
ncbi:MAG TPA: TolC family protein [Polyangiales bacterium]|jgi:outer membrane protein